MPKQFSLTWAFEPFEEDETFFSKRMFGGLSAYLRGKMVMCLTESPGDREWRGETYDFDIWNGVLFPTEREHHESLKGEFDALVNHPILPKWLYLPMTTSTFEEDVMKLSQRIAEGDGRFGIEPGQKKKKAKKKKASKKKVKKKKKR